MIFIVVALVRSVGDARGFESHWQRFFFTKSVGYGKYKLEGPLESVKFFVRGKEGSPEINADEIACFEPQGTPEVLR